MHERTRRAVARMMFVFGCALPTALTFLVVLTSYTPWYAHYRRVAIETALSTRIGLTVSIDAVEFPAPATIRLTGLRLCDPETLDEVARVRVATWVRTDQKSAIRLSQPELQSSRLPLVWRVVHERFLCQPDLTLTPVRFAADDLTIHSRSGPATLRDVDAWLRPDDARVEAVIQCVPAARRDDAPIHVTVTRDRGGDLPTTQWTLHTGDLSLPCSALADYLPALRQLGPDALFTGTLRWRLSDGGWAIDLGGSRFDSVDLSDLLQNVPHRLTGQSRLVLERFLLEPGRSVDVSGTLVAGPGFVGQSLLKSFGATEGFDLTPLVDSPDRDLAFEMLALRFDLFGSQLTLAGICHQQRGQEYLPPAVVLASGSHAILTSRAVPQPWSTMLRAIWPDNQEMLPVSPQTGWLFGILPAPRSTGLSGGTPLTQPRITAAGQWTGQSTIEAP